MVADEPLQLVVGQQAPPVGLRDDLPGVRRPAAVGVDLGVGALGTAEVVRP